MPKLPMPPTDPKKLEKNIKEQYEALGRFVEAFELMVDASRGVCIDRTWDAITDDTELEFNHQDRKKILEIPFHHQNMGAKALWNTMRAILAEIFAQKDNPHHVEYDDFKALLGYMEREYSFLCNRRNELLHRTHGSWDIRATKTPTVINFAFANSEPLPTVL